MAENNKCPVFNDENYEKILTWADAKIEWTDTFIDGKGNILIRPNLAHWSLSWKNGFIGFDAIANKKNEKEARQAAALFIYLWVNGITCDIAEKCAVAYVKRWLV